MLEWRDGNIDEPEPIDDALTKLKDRLGEVRALHVGSEEELTRQRRRMLEREEASLEGRISRLESEVQALADSVPARSDSLHIPTSEEVEKFSSHEEAG